MEKEKEFQKLQEIEFLKMQSESVKNQMNEILRGIKEIEDAIYTIKEIENLKEGDELMIPIGAGCFTFGTLKNKEKVLVSLGAGVAVEKNSKTAEIPLLKREEDLKKILEEAQYNFQRTEQRLEALNKELKASSKL